MRTCRTTPTLALLLLFGVSISGAATKEDFLIHEQLTAVPSTFVDLGPASPEQVLALRLALTPRDPGALEKTLYAVSTPGTPSYGKHLTKTEADLLVAPSAESLSAVTSWLSGHNVSYDAASTARDWLSVNVTVSQANALFNANFSSFTERETGVTAVRAREYALPASLRQHIEFVHPITTFPVRPSRGLKAFRSSNRREALPFQQTVSDLAGRADIPVGCNRTVTPVCLQSMYGIPSANATQPSNRIAVTGFDGEIANVTDIQLFLRTYRPDLDASAVPSFVSIDGGITTNPDDLPAGGEACLDLEWTMGVASNVPVTFISAGTDGPGPGYLELDVFNSILAQEHPPHVVTTSYSYNEGLQLTEPLMRKLCSLFGLLGARGTTVIFSSGDGGVQGGGNVNDCTTFVPTFPSTCPYVTSVGATAYVPPGEIPFPYSSGGFSNIFPTPAFQRSAVQSYVQRLGDTYAGLYNASGRGFPDLAIAGVDMVLAFNGVARNGGGGTSYSAPVIASIVALLNDELIGKGRRPLGWLNPLLYSAPWAFNDIQTGHMTGCGTTGFNATAGWDPASGLGSPKYAELRKAVGL
ncbi:subtilisin-like protein [Auriscalpium vulgare]|uniref:Subtilisin-like protein n=1 Tax=Auriscalpium vulgare TaxID=40419 RepID=A0ACB8RRE1_9AGAM|nr:subtilisin-like protein [Auriscalpium vulgare]